MILCNGIPDEINLTVMNQDKHYELFTLEQFQQYIDLFNHNDPGFAEFYHPDVVLELGNSKIESRQGIIEFYREVKTYIRESLQVTQFIADAEGIAVELPSAFTCIRDWQDSFWGRPLSKGEVMRIISFVHYRVKEGKFTHIKSARYKVVNDWQKED
jgi:hypothetical protein